MTKSTIARFALWTSACLMAVGCAAAIIANAVLAAVS